MAYQVRRRLCFCNFTFCFLKLLSYHVSSFLTFTFVHSSSTSFISFYRYRALHTALAALSLTLAHSSINSFFVSYLPGTAHGLGSTVGAGMAIVSGGAANRSPAASSHRLVNDDGVTLSDVRAQITIFPGDGNDSTPLVFNSLIKAAKAPAAAAALFEKLAAGDVDAADVVALEPLRQRRFMRRMFDVDTIPVEGNHADGE
jgi:hypothetical protein